MFLCIPVELPTSTYCFICFQEHVSDFIERISSHSLRCRPHKTAGLGFACAKIHQLKPTSGRHLQEQHWWQLTDCPIPTESTDGSITGYQWATELARKIITFSRCRDLLILAVIITRPVHQSLLISSVMGGDHGWGPRGLEVTWRRWKGGPNIGGSRTDEMVAKNVGRCWGRIAFDTFFVCSWVWDRK